MTEEQSIVPSKVGVDISVANDNGSDYTADHNGITTFLGKDWLINVIATAQNYYNFWNMITAIKIFPKINHVNNVENVEVDRDILDHLESKVFD